MKVVGSVQVKGVMFSVSDSNPDKVVGTINDIRDKMSPKKVRNTLKPKRARVTKPVVKANAPATQGGNATSLSAYKVTPKDGGA